MAELAQTILSMDGFEPTIIKHLAQGCGSTAVNGWIGTHEFLLVNLTPTILLMDLVYYGAHYLRTHVLCNYVKGYCLLPFCAN